LRSSWLRNVIVVGLMFMILMSILKNYVSESELLLITDNTCLFHDLYIFGDDASELLTEIESKLCIDFSDFNFESYFPNEGFYIPFLSNFINKRKKKKFSIGHLKKVVSCEYWFEP